MKDYTKIVFILDRSGSMEHLQYDTIGSFNSLIKKQKRKEGKCVISTVLFDNYIDTLHNNIDIREISKMTDKEYYTRGTTALLDAVGKSVQKTIWQYNDLYIEERPDKVLFVIITDGMENASIEYDYRKVKRLISSVKEKHGWEFLFIGANIDAIKEGSKLGINPSNAANYRSDKKGNDVMYNAVEDTITAFRESKQINKNWKDRINQDMSSRKEK